MNEVIHVIESRRSCRKYQDTPVAKELIDQVAEAGSYAASGMGRQSALIVEVLDRRMRDRLSAMNAAIMGTETDPFYGAPAVLVVLADRNVPTHVYDGSLVIGNMMLAAHSLGLGSCWIHRAREEFDSQEGKALLKEWGIEGEYEGIGHLILGWPEQDGCKAAPRKQGYIHTVGEEK